MVRVTSAPFSQQGFSQNGYYLITQAFTKWYWEIAGIFKEYYVGWKPNGDGFRHPALNPFDPSDKIKPQ